MLAVSRFRCKYRLVVLVKRVKYSARMEARTRQAYTCLAKALVIVRY